MVKSLLTLAFLIGLVTTTHAKAMFPSLPPDSTTSILDKISATNILNDGKRMFEAGRVRDALTRFREASVKDPYSWKPSFWISKCHYILNNYGLSLKYAFDAFDQGSKDVDKEVFELIGKNYHRTGNIDSALYYYKLVSTRFSSSEMEEFGIREAIAECEFVQKEVAQGKKSRHVPLPTVNSGYNDYAPIIADNGKTLYITSRRPDTKGGEMNPDDQEYFEDIYRALWNAETNTWDSLSNDLERINSNGFDALSFVSNDGLQGIMTINTTESKSKIATKGSDLFLVTKSNKDKWSAPQKIESGSINTSYFEGSATMTSDGNTLYFVSDRDAEEASLEIFVSYKADNKWSKPKALPKTVNTPGRETTPFITGDGRFLFFSSDGHLGMGGLDVYVVENLGNSWGTPVNLGMTINTVNNDTHFQYYPALKKGVLSSFQIIGQKSSMDVFEVDMSDFNFPVGK